MKMYIKFFTNSSVVISVALIFFGAGVLDSDSTCHAQSPWTQKTDMQWARAGHSSCALDGKIYVMGGVNTIFGSSLKSLIVYDPILDTWTSKANMIIARANFPSCMVNGKIYAVGGAKSLFFDAIGTIEEYDPVSDTWSHKTDMPRARMGHSASLVDGKVYIIGGAIGHYDCYPEVDVYDTLTKTWTTVSDFPTPRMNFTAVVLNGKIYTIGGMLGLQEGERGKTIVEEYDPVADTWTKKADMIKRRKYLSACVADGKIYVFGGAQNYCDGTLSIVEEYNPATDTWREITIMPSILALHSVAQVNGNIYISGGNSVDCATTCDRTMYEYIPHNDLFPLIENVSVDRSYTKPGTGSVWIETNMRDTTGIKLLAEIEAPDQTPIDSLQLFDDGNHNDVSAGDSIYANFWSVSSAEERNYYVDIHVTRVGADTIIHNINNMVLFTTIGPVTVDDYIFTSSDTIFNPGDNLRIYLTLKNNSPTVTVTNIGAKLFGLDTLATVGTTLSRSFGDIASGESSKSNSTYAIKISEECPLNTPISIMAEITSDDYVFWRDTFSILVQTSIEDIIEPATRIYPNPADDILNIEINNTGDQVLELEILSVTGRVIFQKEYRNTNAHYSEQIVLTGYAKGIYIIKVRQADRVYFGKVVVR